MSIALIHIPHQHRPRIIWFGDREDVIDAALTLAFLNRKKEAPDFDDAVSYLADDWHGHILIESAADVDQVRNYQGHQKQHVRAMLEELEDAFIPWEPNTDDTT